MRVVMNLNLEWARKGGGRKSEAMQVVVCDRHFR